MLKSSFAIIQGSQRCFSISKPINLVHCINGFRDRNQMVISIVVEKAVEKKIHQPSIIKRAEETQKRE